MQRSEILRVRISPQLRVAIEARAQQLHVALPELVRLTLAEAVVDVAPSRSRFPDENQPGEANFPSDVFLVESNHLLGLQNR